MKKKTIVLFLGIATSLCAVNEAEKEKGRLSYEKLFKQLTEKTSILEYSKGLYELVHESRLLLSGSLIIPRRRLMSQGINLNDTNNVQIRTIVEKISTVDSSDIVFGNEEKIKEVKRSLREAIETEEEKINALHQLRSDSKRWHQFEQWCHENQTNQEECNNIEETAKQQIKGLTAYLAVVDQLARDSKEFIENYTDFLKTGNDPFEKTNKKALRVFNREFE